MLYSRALFIGFFLALVFARVNMSCGLQSDKIIFMQPQLNPNILKVIAGHIPGLVADFEVLDVFSLYNAFGRSKHSNFGKMLAYHLRTASYLDPQFQDVYRLASSLLVFDAKMPKEAVSLLMQGTKAVTHSWESPFFGGIIAAGEMSDYKQAYAMMSIAAQREGVPPAAEFLAARYLKHESSQEDTILFLKGMLQIMPKDYQLGIRSKIQELQR